MSHVDPTPTRLDLPKRDEDVILDTQMQAIFKGSPEEVKAELETYSPEYQDLVSVFCGQITKIVSVTVYLLMFVPAAVKKEI